MANAPRKIAVIGLGYVGLPLAVALGAHLPTLGFDVAIARVEELCRGEDRNREIDLARVALPLLTFSHDEADLEGADVYIVTVPTPVDNAHRPDLAPLISASQLVGKRIRPGSIVVFESTVYPGCTEEICLPILEKVSGLKGERDFQVGYSPERINPGDTEHILETIVKVVSAQTEAALEVLADIYGCINGGKIHRAANIRTAEAAKVIENTQRDLNIALMNELAILFHRLDIRTQDVLAAVRTKWNFLPFFPGLVGGHCIPVDPYYLTHKAEMVGYHPEIILAGRRLNDHMAHYLSHEVVKKMAQVGLHLNSARVLVLGATFKPNVRDLRNSQVFELVKELEGFGMSVLVHDPVAEPEALKKRGVSVLETAFGHEDRFQVVVLATAHQSFASRSTGEYYALLDPDQEGVVVDVTGKLSAQHPRGPRQHFWQL